MPCRPGGWVRAYVDAPGKRQQPAAAAFARTALQAFGKVEDVKFVPVSLTGGGGWYKIDVAGGKIMHVVTQPVLGADKKTPISHNNIADPLNHTFYQGKTISGSFKDGNRSFTLKGSNSYFNDRMNASGSV
jgi:hypothetical protein